VRLSVAVQHHPSRAPIIPALVAALEADPADRGITEIVADPEPDGVANPWRTYRECLARTPADCTHRLVLQDDVLVCPGFTAAVRAAIAARPDRPLAFFVGGQSYAYAQAVYQAAGRGEPWALLDSHIANYTWVPVVALCWPASLALGCVPWADNRLADQPRTHGWRADDEIAGNYLHELGVPVLASVPSLVEHPDVIASVIHGRGFGGSLADRQAACFIGDCPVATMDWTLGPC
jgi:hypothetical protein